MSRKELYVTIPMDNPENRDKGKIYYIREMSARALERWAVRAVIALQNAGLVVPDNSGIAGVAQAGIGSLMKLDFVELEPLLDEMMTCVQAIPPSGDRTIKMNLGTFEGDIEEVSTLFLLRWEVIKMHMDFLPADVRSKLASAVTIPGLKTTQTSPPQ